MRLSRITILVGCSAAAMAAALFFYLSIFSSAGERVITPERDLLMGDVTLSVAVADTPHEREKGLGGTTMLSPREGMLFIFEKDGQHSFWMKDVPYPIDIIWISSDKRIVHIERTVSPDSFPQAFTPPTPARYVLEVVGGFVEEHRVEVGTRIEF